mgnify:CR=1 FL=1
MRRRHNGYVSLLITCLGVLICLMLPRGLRQLAVEAGQVMAADRLGKWKTTFQLVFCITCLTWFALGPAGGESTPLAGLLRQLSHPDAWLTPVSMWLALFLTLLSGRRHRVHSAVTLIDATGKARHRVSTSTLAFKRLSASEIDAYVAGGEWQGKAGGYAVQGYAEAFVRSLSGSHSGVMGLPLFETRALLQAAGLLNG